MIIYIFAIYFNASYYLPNGYVQWTSDVDWGRQISLIPDVTLREIKEIMSLSKILILALFYFIIIFFSSFLNKNTSYSILLLTTVAIGLIYTYYFLDVISFFMVLVYGGFDGEWLGEGWPEMHAHGILLICVLFTIYLYYKESKLL